MKSSLPIIFVASLAVAGCHEAAKSQEYYENDSAARQSTINYCISKKPDYPYGPSDQDCANAQKADRAVAIKADAAASKATAPK